MKVSALYRPEVLSAHAGEDLTIAASRMTFHEVGALAVFDRGVLVGIITERDLTRAVADGGDVSRVTVRHYMTEDPATVTPDDDVGRAAALMVELGARHLPVIEAGKMVGMISARDMLSLEAWDQSAAQRS